MRTESASSSEIENLTSSARQIALAELGQHASRNAHLIVGVRAMQAALTLSESIDTLAILEIHRALLEQIDPDIVLGRRLGAGAFSGSQREFVQGFDDGRSDPYLAALDVAAGLERTEGFQGSDVAVGGA